MTNHLDNFQSTLKLCGIAFAIFILCTMGATVEAKIKCWTNHEGVRECGNAVPPEFAQKGHEQLSEGGAKITKTERAKSIEELEAERQVESAAAEQASLEKDKADRDRVLLATFSSEDDMVLARDGQLSHLESQVKITESHISKLERSLEGLIERAAGFERRSKEPPKKLVSDIGSLRRQISENKAFINTKAVERVDILRKFESDIDRFRELKVSR